jgi:hypothetical protein
MNLAPYQKNRPEVLLIHPNTLFLMRELRSLTVIERMRNVV